jgi:hypothetical protein
MTTIPEVEEVQSPEEPTGKAVRTLLEVWRELLSSIEIVKGYKVGPAEASKVLRNWPSLKVQELTRYHELFYDYMTSVRNILTLEIESDPQCLQNVDDDGIDNSAHYLNLILQWQLQMDQWSYEWDCDAEDAHVRMASLAEAQAFVFGPEGMAQHLDHIDFDFSEEDSNMVADALVAAKEARE